MTASMLTAAMKATSLLTRRRPGRQPVPSLAGYVQPPRENWPVTPAEIEASPSPCGRCGASPGEVCITATGLAASEPCGGRGSQ